MIVIVLEDGPILIVIAKTPAMNCYKNYRQQWLVYLEIHAEF